MSPVNFMSAINWRWRERGRGREKERERGGREREAFKERGVDKNGIK